MGISLGSLLLQVISFEHRFSVVVLYDGVYDGYKGIKAGFPAQMLDALDKGDSAGGGAVPAQRDARRVVRRWGRSCPGGPGWRGVRVRPGRGRRRRPNLAGSASDGTSSSILAVRLGKDGTPDASFGTDGAATFDLGKRFGSAGGAALTPGGSHARRLRGGRHDEQHGRPAPHGRRRARWRVRQPGPRRAQPVRRRRADHRPPRRLDRPHLRRGPGRGGDRAVVRGREAPGRRSPRPELLPRRRRPRECRARRGRRERDRPGRRTGRSWSGGTHGEGRRERRGDGPVRHRRIARPHVPRRRDSRRRVPGTGGRGVRRAGRRRWALDRRADPRGDRRPDPDPPARRRCERRPLLDRRCRAHRRGRWRRRRAGARAPTRRGRGDRGRGGARRHGAVRGGALRGRGLRTGTGVDWLRPGELGQPG